MISVCSVLAVRQAERPEQSKTALQADPFRSTRDSNRIPGYSLIDGAIRTED